MKVKILKRALIAVEPGSIVEISESQFKALGDKAALIDEPVEVVMEVPKEAKPSTSKRTSRKKREE